MLAKTFCAWRKDNHNCHWLFNLASWRSTNPSRSDIMEPAIPERMPPYQADESLCNVFSAPCQGMKYSTVGVTTTGPCDTRFDHAANYTCMWAARLASHSPYPSESQLDVLESEHHFNAMLPTNFLSFTSAESAQSTAPLRASPFAGPLPANTTAAWSASTSLLATTQLAEYVSQPEYAPTQSLRAASLPSIALHKRSRPKNLRRHRPSMMATSINSTSLPQQSAATLSHAQTLQVEVLFCLLYNQDTHRRHASESSAAVVLA